MHGPMNVKSSNHCSTSGRSNRIFSSQRIQTGAASTKHPTEWVAGALYKRIKLPERKVNPPAFRVKFKNKWSYTSIPSCLSGA